jgi:hypothetical protein
MLTFRVNIAHSVGETAVLRTLRLSRTVRARARGDREDRMTEMRNMKCPTCEVETPPLAVVDGIREYRCRACGLVFYGPCGCDVEHPEAMEAQGESGDKAALPDDWQMSARDVEVPEGPSTRVYPGCS